MIRRLAAAALLVPALAAADSLHHAPVGTKVASSFELGQHQVYLPAGDWTLIARHEWKGTSGTVLEGPHFGATYLAERSEERRVGKECRL